MNGRNMSVVTIIIKLHPSAQVHLLVFLKILYTPVDFMHKAEEKEEMLQDTYE